VLPVDAVLVDFTERAPSAFCGVPPLAALAATPSKTRIEPTSNAIS
jgi:hypothetical protein